MQFCVARKKIILSRPQSATPKLSKPVRPSNIQTPISFCSYFFAEDKECQTVPDPRKAYRLSICPKFLRSHRDSIEREVTSIFKEQSKSKRSEETEIVKGKDDKSERFADLLKQAKGHRNRSRNNEGKLSICVTKAKINKKCRVLPCNQHFGTPKRDERYLQVMTPKLGIKKNSRCESLTRVQETGVRGEWSKKKFKVSIPYKKEESICLEGWNDQK